MQLLLSRAGSRSLFLFLLFLSVESVGLAGVSIQWDPSPSSDVIGYYVYRGSGLNSLQRINQKPIENLWLRDIATPSSGPLFLAVRSVNSHGVKSAFSDVIQVPAGSSSLDKIVTGRITLHDEWVTVALRRSFKNPVVIVKPLGFEGHEPATIRIRNVTSSTFEARIQEWDYQDGQHQPESASFLVAESGRWELPGGFTLEAGTARVAQWGESSRTSIDFLSRFTDPPVVLTSVVSDVGTDAVVTRNTDITRSGFSVFLQEQERHPRTRIRNDQLHISEDVSWLAIREGSGSTSGHFFEARRDAFADDFFRYVEISSGFQNIPCVVADFQESKGLDPSNLRLTGQSRNGFFAKVQDEQSWDVEIDHLPERIGFLAIDCISGTSNALASPQLLSSSSLASENEDPFLPGGIKPVVPSHAGVIADSERSPLFEYPSERLHFLLSSRDSSSRLQFFGEGYLITTEDRPSWYEIVDYLEDGWMSARHRVLAKKGVQTLRAPSGLTGGWISIHTSGSDDTEGLLVFTDPDSAQVDALPARLPRSEYLVLSYPLHNPGASAFLYLHNSELAEATVELNWLGVSESRGGVMRTIPAGKTLQADLGTLFSPDDMGGYLEVRSNQPLVGFGILKGPEEFLASAATPLQKAGSLVIPHFASGAAANTDLLIGNPHDEIQSVSLEIFQTDSGLLHASEVELLPGEVRNIRIESLIESHDTSNLTGSIRVASAHEILFSGTLELAAGSRTRLPVLKNGSKRSLIPIIDPLQGLAFQTGLLLLNQTDQPTPVTISAFDTESRLISRKDFVIDSGDQYVGFLANKTLFKGKPGPVRGYLKIKSEAPLEVFSFVTDLKGKSLISLGP